MSIHRATATFSPLSECSKHEYRFPIFEATIQALGNLYMQRFVQKNPGSGQGSHLSRLKQRGESFIAVTNIPRAEQLWYAVFGAPCTSLFGKHARCTRYIFTARQSLRRTIVPRETVEEFPREES